MPQSAVFARPRRFQNLGNSLEALAIRGWTLERDIDDFKTGLETTPQEYGAMPGRNR